MKRNLLIFATIFVLGSVLGTLGTISFPVGVNITYFWPAAALQTVSGIFFGLYGILGGVLFPILTNALTDGTAAHTIGFIPANIAQTVLPLLMVRKLNISLDLKKTRDVLLFVIGASALPHILGAMIGCATLYFLGTIQNSKEFWSMVSVWIIGNVPCSVVFGYLLVKTFTPVLKDCGLYYDGFWK